MSQITTGYVPHHNETKDYLDLLVIYQHLEGREKFLLKRKVDFYKLKVKYGFKCANCKREEPEIKFERDHIIPRKLGGSNDFNNFQLLCSSCNHKKFTSIINYRHHPKFEEVFVVKYSHNIGKRLSAKYSKGAY